MTRSQIDVDLAETLGTYELSCVPRSMFAYDGSMNLCSAKSKLMTILKNLTEPSPDSQNVSTPQLSFCVAVVDAMAEVQALDKSADMKTCAHLGSSFTLKMLSKYGHFDEVHFVFDSYTKESIKNLTRNKRLHGDNASEYKICDNTDIHNVNMKKLLSHIRTKDALTDYLAYKLLQSAQQNAKNYVVAWRAEAAATHCAVDFLRSTQEEADTKIILHAINAAEIGATRLLIFAQDTDVLVLAVRHYLKLPQESFFVPGPKEHISLKQIFHSLGPQKASALPGFHALSLGVIHVGR